MNRFLIINGSRLLLIHALDHEQALDYALLIGSEEDIHILEVIEPLIASDCENNTP